MKKKTGIILTVVVLLCVAIAVFVYGNIKGDSANQGNSSTTQDGIQTEQLKEDEKQAKRMNVLLNHTIY